MKKFLLGTLLPAFLMGIFYSYLGLGVFEHPVKGTILIITFWLFPLWLDYVDEITRRKL